MIASGHRPETGDSPLRVTFRNGKVSGPYTALQLRWTQQDRSFGRDYDWDVVAFEMWNAPESSASTWTAKSGGYS
mgnify:CR=1 FL=1